jgi:hypothetical protein
MGKEIRDKVKHYQFGSTELEEDYPTDCPNGSDMEIIDEETHKITGYKVFDGTHWNAL